MLDYRKAEQDIFSEPRDMLLSANNVFQCALESALADVECLRIENKRLLTVLEKTTEMVDNLLTKYMN